METLQQLFGSPGSVSWGQEAARALLVFVYGLVAVRLVGRRLFGKWAALDIVVSVIIGSNLSRALTGNAPLWGTLAATTLLFLLHWLLSRAAVQWEWASKFIEGRPHELARDGEIRMDVARRWSISEADLDEALRQAGVLQMTEAHLLILEPSGKISVVRPVASA